MFDATTHPGTAMNRFPRFALTASTLLLVTAALPGRAAERLTVVEHPTNETTVDLGPKGDSIGDLLVFANPVFDAANKVQVGKDQGQCVRTVVGKSWECFWTLILKDGLITVEGPFSDDGSDSTFVVTGGTGKYIGAKGSMKLHWRDAKGAAYDFVYDLQ
jgi:allene oxide cyclase